MSESPPSTSAHSLSGLPDTSGYRVGDVITFAAHIPWWRRFWNWLLRRKPPNPPEFIVTEVINVSTVVIEQCEQKN
jgi:hypothetical protein